MVGDGWSRAECIWIRYRHDNNCQARHDSIVETWPISRCADTVGGMSRALITGASAGIGNAFARQLAAQGTNVVLVARDQERLTQLAEQLRTHGVEVEVLRADLSLRADVDAVAARLEDDQRPIDMLVNNAGFGLHAKLLEDLDSHERAIDVMVIAVMILSAAAGRAMKRRGEGTIINVGSTSGLIYSGNYSAIKAWVNSYTQGLANELHGTGVTVTALLPGWVRTEFHQRAGISASSLPDVVWIEADELVRECLKDAHQGKVVSIPTKKWAIAARIAPRVPQNLVRYFSRLLSKSRSKT